MALSKRKVQDKLNESLYFILLTIVRFKVLIVHTRKIIELRLH